MDTLSSTQDSTEQQEQEHQATDLSPKASDEKAQIKGMLSEARTTRDVLIGFRSAIESGTYHGAKMLDLAKGLAFLEAILNQNQGHIKALQERLNV